MRHAQLFVSHVKSVQEEIDNAVQAGTLEATNIEVEDPVSEETYVATYSQSELCNVTYDSLPD